MKKKRLFCILFGIICLVLGENVNSVGATSYAVDATVGEVAWSESENERVVVSTPDTGVYNPNVGPALSISTGGIVVLTASFIASILAIAKKYFDGII
ncbi:hypothetical protein IJ118_01690 [Candidatus Saccharibacteria bacterium]|nr:hypothetical protein [Candidatus Saccharibacteria bacterium]